MREVNGTLGVGVKSVDI